MFVKDEGIPDRLQIDENVFVDASAIVPGREFHGDRNKMLVMKGLREIK